MSPENARRLRERQEHDRIKIPILDVGEYRRIHFPESEARRLKFLAEGGVEIPGDRYIATLDHDRFHEWFGTECDETCPHDRPDVRMRSLIPRAHLPRRSWWRRLLGL